MAFSRSNKIVSDNVVTSAHNMTLRQSILPCLLVTSLFFLWGFAYGLLDVLNSHFQKLLNINSSRASGLAASYFGAYFLCPLTISGWILRRYGFRVTFISGLSVLCVGCLLFWPSGVKASFGGFCGSMFVVGAGLSTLETAADPFLAICGPPRYSEIRLNLAQACQGVGSLVAPLLASYVFFKDLEDTSSSLKAVQWVYLGVACFVAVLAVVFWFVPMPEVTDADMGLQESEIGEIDPGPLRKQYNLFLGVISQFCYVGAQVALAGNFIPYCTESGKSSAYATKLLSAAQGIYAGMRFISSFLMMSPHIKPRFIMLTYLALCFILGIVAMKTTGSGGIAVAMLIFAFESACFATIFSTALRGLGRHTKRGGSFLVAAISGGSVFPAIMGAVIVKRDVHFSMIVPAIGYLIALSFPIYVNIFNRASIDLHRATDHGIAAPTEKQMELEHQGTNDKSNEVRTIEDAN